MVEFAGYSMPVQYPSGIVTEHNHTREKAGLYDVSHMGQAWLKGENHEHVSSELEKLVPGDIAALAPGRTRYTQFTNQDGGILDDLMVTRLASSSEDGILYLVVNASRKTEDYQLMSDNLDPSIKLEKIEDRALLALQGPSSEKVVAGLCEGIEETAFMSSQTMMIGGIECWVSRSGYTGEDGFEISVKADEATALAEKLLAHEDVMACGLGARDSLRLEAGLCLYGNDIDETTSPIEAGLIWSISKRRRAEGGFPGAARVQSEIANGVSRKRVGIKPDGRAPARAGTEITSVDGAVIGTLTSGGFGPSIEGPISMGYVPTEYSEAGTKLNLLVRGKALPATVTALPFIPNNFKR
ncbi:Aminomethyltransferase, mitochondrial [Nymphon striatum]|nr:Aminomethyltransferase, mitochondrial [Nymphon striatum]